MSITRFKREECKRTKHDSVFSKWEILIGAHDWENHKLGTIGIQRYRLHNIPLISSCPGLYELGVAAVRTDLGRGIRTLDSDSIVVVYLGQADNVRNRLQHYGRAGSHLILNFGEVFTLGFPIVFRWVAMESKKVAEMTEANLLRVFDYAWNKGGNGDRRPQDVYFKLHVIVSRNVSAFFHAKKWLENYVLRQKKHGIKIKAKDVKFRVKLGVVKREFGMEEDLIVCGLSLGDGDVCTRTPCKGRKRCEEHKGKKNVRPSSHWVTQGKLIVSELNVKEESVCVEISPHGGDNREEGEGKGVNTSENSDKMFLPGEVGSICGIVLNDQSICGNIPIAGRKRCPQHKGMRINETLRKSAPEGNMHICGVDLGNGNACMEIPVHGRKRCESHKGRRTTASSY